MQQKDKEFRNQLKRDGVIKNNYDAVSDETVSNYLKNKTGKISRMDYILESHLRNDAREGTNAFSEIMKRYNNLPAAVPAIIGAGAAIKNETDKQRKYYKK